MEKSQAKTPRERYRAEVRAEIKGHAWEQVATAGASALSLNAIAKRMGMSGPALYRYYAGRDELITELVKDAYRGLADALREASRAGADPAGLAHALRGWALQHPQRYFLIYGTPVPGYHAPEETVSLASEMMAILLDAFTALPGDSPARPFDAHLEDHRDWAAATPPAPRSSTRPWPSGPVCTESSPWNSRATSPPWASTPPASSRRNWTTCWPAGPDVVRGARRGAMIPGRESGRYEGEGRRSAMPTQGRPEQPTTELDARYSSALNPRPGAEDVTPTEWAEAQRHLEAAEIFWVSTVRPDGRLHVTPVIAAWHRGVLYFSTGAEEQKARNLAHDGHCALTTGGTRSPKGSTSSSRAERNRWPTRRSSRR